MDTYLGHVDLASHLIIASVQCFWAIDRRSREPWCVSWEEISHFNQVEGGIRIVVFSQSGLKTFTFQTETNTLAEGLIQLLSMQLRKMVWPLRKGDTFQTHFTLSGQRWRSRQLDAKYRTRKFV
jgi:hypothetical protein